MVIEEASSRSATSGYWSNHLPATYNNVLSDKIVLRDSVQEQPYPSLDLLLQIAGELEAADSADAFIEDMVDAFGIPLWNYSIIKGSESDDYIVSIPFDRITDDTTISGILKYYYHDDESEVVFIARSELDSLIQTPPDTGAFDGYIKGVFFDFLIFEFNLHQNLNPLIFDYLQNAANIDESQIQPRFYYFCVPKIVTHPNFVFIHLQEGGVTPIADFFIHQISHTLISVLEGPSGGWSEIFEDCYIIDFPYFDFYADIGANWSQWPEFFQWYLNNVLAGGSSGSGSGSGTPPPPTPTPIQLCLNGNFPLMVAADKMRLDLVDACDPSFNAGLAVDNALMAACDDMKPNQISSFYKALPHRAYQAFLLKDYVKLKIQQHPEEEADLLAFQASFNELACTEPDIRADRAIELFELLKVDPYLLIKDCFSENDEFDLTFWSDLASFIPSQSVIDVLDQIPGDWDIQTIEDGSAAKVNLDYFAVNVTQLPDIDNDGTPETIWELFYHLRTNISDYTYPWSAFIPVTATDEIKWSSSDPLTAILSIEIQPPVNDGSVIVSHTEYCCFVFTTLDSPWSGDISNFADDNKHPVCGNRQFGFKQEQDGSWTIYVKGADRVQNWFAGQVSSISYSLGDNLWNEFQNSIVELVNNVENGGMATKKTAIKNRPKWNKVREALLSDSPLTFISCD